MVVFLQFFFDIFFISFGQMSWNFVATQNALPKSPRRRKAVHRKLYESELDGSSISSSTDSPRRSDASSDELVELVKAFYQRDDISRRATGRKDVTNVREKMDKRFLIKTVISPPQSWRLTLFSAKSTPTKLEKVNLLNSDQSIFYWVANYPTMYACVNTMRTL